MMTTEEKKAYLATLESKYQETKEISIIDKPLSDEEILSMNDTIMSLGKHKVLQFLKEYDTVGASASQMKLISEIIDMSFKQNKSIKERQAPESNITINNFGENETIIKLLQVNGLR